MFGKKALKTASKSLSTEDALFPRHLFSLDI